MNKTLRKPKADWFATKFENHHGRWRAARKGHVISRLVSDLMARAYQQALESHARGTLIDLGCGNAPLAGIYRTLVDKYLWADWPNSFHQIFELDHEVDLNQRLPFESNGFDTIVLSDVLEHIAEPDQLFDELARILRPSGHLIVGVPFLYHLHEEPHDYYRFTRFKLAQFGAKHRLDIVEIREVGGGIDCLVDMSCKLLGRIRKPLARIPYHSWVVLRSLPPIRRLNKRSMRSLPLAYIAVYQAPS